MKTSIKRKIAAMFAALTLMTVGTATLTSASAAKMEDAYVTVETKSHDETYCEKDELGKVKGEAAAKCRINSDGKAEAVVKVNASVAAGHTETTVKKGSDENNVKVTMEGDALKAACGTEAGMAYQNGKVEAKLAVNAEATLYEVGAKGTATVGGVEFGAGASVKVGFGAKGSVAYKDGKMKVELGAAFGIGGTFTAEVDIGSAVKKIADSSDQIADYTKNAAKSAWNKIKSWF